MTFSGFTISDQVDAVVTEETLEPAVAEAIQKKHPGYRAHQRSMIVRARLEIAS